MQPNELKYFYVYSTTAFSVKKWAEENGIVVDILYNDYYKFRDKASIYTLRTSKSEYDKVFDKFKVDIILAEDDKIYRNRIENIARYVRGLDGSLEEIMFWEQDALAHDFPCKHSEMFGIYGWGRLQHKQFLIIYSDVKKYLESNIQ